MKNKWTTKDGVRMNIEDMETSHIKNAIAMLEDIWTGRLEVRMPQ